jgi:TonB-linked SusC/RagA family outer membrane protein
MDNKLWIIVLSAICLLPVGMSAKDVRVESAATVGSSVQQSSVYKGKVIDAKTKEPLMGAAVYVKGTTIGVATDANGEFSINVPAGKQFVLEVSFISYKTVEISPKRSMGIIVELTDDQNFLNAVQVVAYGQQRKTSITGAITSISSDDILKSPSGSAASSLAGALTGVSSIQVSGQPGASDPDIYVRGSGSLTNEASKPLILVDGVERSFFQMDPNEIDNITVLKDAASTAVFGVRGANGVILVTTKRGEEGKAKINWSSSFGLTQPMRHLTAVSSYDHAKIFSEAQMTDNWNDPNTPLTFSDAVTEMFRTNADPIMFPNTNWDKYLFHKLSWQTQHNITVSGGADRVKYFVSVGYLYQDGMLKSFENYNANYTYNRYNYRANVDVDVTPTTLLKLNIGGRVGKRHEPNGYGSNIWQYITWCTPYSSPGFVDGHYTTPALGDYIPIGGGMSGLGLYYGYGYHEQTGNTLNLDIQINQKLDFITKGLSANVKGASNSSYYVYVNRTPTASASRWQSVNYMGHYTQPGMKIDNPLYDNTHVFITSGEDNLDEPLSYSSYTSKSRDWYLEGSLNYSRQFGNHEVTGLLLYNQSKTYYPSNFPEIPTAYVGYVGRVTYNYKRKYLADFNVGYNGSENFAPGRRYGFFPAGSIGWVVTEEPWMASTKNWLDFFKLRASYGLVGNDKYSGARFLYLNGSWNPDHSNAHFGNWGSWQFGSMYSGTMLDDAVENAQGNSVVSWEKCQKQNYGFDLVMFKQQLSVTADFFFEHRYDILSTRNTLPDIADISLPMLNLGVVDNHGYELSATWRSKINQDLSYNITGNLSFSRNKIKYMDEVSPNEPYMAQTGRRTGMSYGYIFDRYLTDSDFDPNTHELLTIKNGGTVPEITLGNPRPGDAIFKDLNNDGKIDSDDNTWYGYGQRPEYVTGVIAGFNWKNFGFSMQWTGAWNASRVLGIEYMEPFGMTNDRALLKYLADGRWTAENQNSRFPRITFKNKSWYTQNSNIWLMDASYLRLKNVELSYTFGGSKLLKKLGVSSLRAYVSGYNLLTLFSDLAKIDIDPEEMTGSANLNGEYVYSYPNVRIYNAGFNISF